MGDNIDLLDAITAMQLIEESRMPAAAAGHGRDRG
jgi:hypothetical protein